MKHRDLINRIAKGAQAAGVTWTLARQGGNHEIYRLGNTMMTIPRHSEIREGLVKKIYKQAETELGTGWWK